MRDLTPFIIQTFTTLQPDGALVLDEPMVAADIKLRDAFGTTFRWATGNITIDTLDVLGVSVPVGPFDYLSYLREDPEVTFNQSHATSGGSLSAQNLDNVVGEFTASLEAIFNRADVRIYFCLKKPSGLYEADTVFVGRITSVGGDQKLCTFELTADTDDKSSVVAGRQLTQRCIWGAVGGYKGAGCRYPGPEPTCSLIKEDVENGCRAKGWEFAFGGANFEVGSVNSDAAGFPYNDPDGFPFPGGGNYFPPGDDDGPGRRGRLPMDYPLGPDSR